MKLDQLPLPWDSEGLSRSCPMSAVTVSDLRDRLQDYLLQVQQGQELSITDGGKTVARLVPTAPAIARQLAIRRLDRYRGTVIVGDIIGTPPAAGWTADEDHL